MVIKVTASLKLTPTDLEPIISGFYDGLADDPPILRVNCRRAGTLYWDYHSSATAPSVGGGNIATGSQAVIGGPNIVKLALTAGTGPGYIHLRCQSADGVSNPLVTQVVTVPSGFDPSDLFASGEKGGFWDINSATAFTDTGRTTAATAGQAIAAIADSSGNGKHALQTDSTKRPLLGQTGGLYYYATDGVDDALFVTLDLNQTDELTIFCLHDVLTVKQNIVAGLVAAYPNFYLVGDTAGETGKYSIARMSSGDTGRRADVTVSPLTEPIFHVGEADISATTVKTWANGQTATTTASFGSGSNWGTGNQFNLNWSAAHVRTYAIGVINRKLTAPELANLQAWAKTRGNITW
jgi:hypothetical protein